MSKKTECDNGCDDVDNECECLYCAAVAHSGIEDLGENIGEEEICSACTKTIEQELASALDKIISIKRTVFNIGKIETLKEIMSDAVDIIKQY